MKLSPRRTKIICTIGPAVSKKEMLTLLAQEGMNVVRLNFSHGHHEDFARTIAELRAIEKELGKPIGIMANLQGPKSASPVSRAARSSSRWAPRST